MLGLKNMLRTIAKNHFSSTIRQQIARLQTDYSNISPKILDLVDRRIHDIEGHPLHTIKEKMRNFFENPEVQKSSYQSKLEKCSYKFLEHQIPIGNPPYNSHPYNTQ